MKREDFEELVRLLRDWLKVAESRNQEATLAHSKLVDWAKHHSRDDVQNVSDAIALRSGFDIEQQGHSRWVMEIGRPDGKTFFSAIDAIDYLLRQISETGFESAIDAITKPLYPWKPRIPFSEIDRSLVALRARLGEELKHLEEEGEPNGCREDEDSVSDKQPSLPNRKKGKLQEDAFNYLADRDLINPGMSARKAAQASVALASKPNSKFISFSKDKARDLMKLRWPTHYQDDET